MTEQLPEVVTASPRRMRWVAIVFGIAVIAVFAVIGALLKGSADGTAFTTADQYAMVGLGILLAAGGGLLARPRVRADREGVRIRNIFARYELPWAVVREVRFPEGTAWAILDLHDDDTVNLLAIQAVDGRYALKAIRGLRALHRAATAGSSTPRPDGG